MIVSFASRPSCIEAIVESVLALSAEKNGWLKITRGKENWEHILREAPLARQRLRVPLMIWTIYLGAFVLSYLSTEQLDL